jgi:hypothetical protein
MISAANPQVREGSNALSPFSKLSLSELFLSAIPCSAESAPSFLIPFHHTTKNTTTLVSGGFLKVSNAA